MSWVCKIPLQLLIIVGHWSLNHTIKLLAIGEVQLFVSFFLFGQVMNWDAMYTNFGFTSKPTMIGLILFFQFIMSPVDHVLSFLLNILSRRFEFQVVTVVTLLKMHRLMRLQSTLDTAQNFDPVFLKSARYILLSP